MNDVSNVSSAAGAAQEARAELQRQLQEQRQVLTTVKQPARPDVQIGRVFDHPFELLWFVIPMWLFRPLVQRHFLRGLPWEVEKNLHRLTGQWSDSIGRTVDDLARQAEDFVREELDTVEGLVAKAQD
jgi:hypothetical protein